MTTLSRPLHAARVAETSNPAGLEPKFSRLVSEWMRLAQAWSEALAHTLPDLEEIGAEHLRIEAVIEAEFPAEWAVLGEGFLQWESSLLHTAEMPSPVCSRCNLHGASIAALMCAAGEAK